MSDDYWDEFHESEFIQFFKISTMVAEPLTKEEKLFRAWKNFTARDFFISFTENIIIWIMFTSHDLISLPLFFSVIENLKFQHFLRGIEFVLVDAAAVLRVASRSSEIFQDTKDEKLCFRYHHHQVSGAEKSHFHFIFHSANGKSKSNWAPELKLELIEIH